MSTFYTVQVDCQCAALGVRFNARGAGYLGPQSTPAAPAWAVGHRKGAGLWTRPEAIEVGRGAVARFVAHYENEGRPVPSFRLIIRPATGGQMITL